MVVNRANNIRPEIKKINIIDTVNTFMVPRRDDPVKRSRREAL